MTIAAKYPGTCTACNHPIIPGQKIEWVKGSRPTHTACQAGQAAKSATPGMCRCGKPIDVKYTQCYSCANPGAARSRRANARANWTGCRCGSIEGTPRDSDCASCQHDY